MRKLHERLRRLRTGKHMTQAEVAERLNVTRQMVASYESGVKDATPQLTLALLPNLKELEVTSMKIVNLEYYYRI